MNRYIKEFIETNKNLIEEGEFSLLFKKAQNGLGDILVAELVKVFQDSGIDFLDYMTEIPPSFARNESIQSFDIPIGFTSIGRDAFTGCKELKKNNNTLQCDFDRKGCFCGL